MVENVVEPVIPDTESDKTTIPCKKSTRIRVKDYGKKGESYDSLLNRKFDEIDQLQLEIKKLKEEYNVR